MSVPHFADIQIGAGQTVDLESFAGGSIFNRKESGDQLSWTFISDRRIVVTPKFWDGAEFQDEPLSWTMEAGVSTISSPRSSDRWTWRIKNLDGALLANVTMYIFLGSSEMPPPNPYPSTWTFTQDGDRSGSAVVNANGNYSDAGLGPVNWELRPPASEIWLIDQIVVRVQDTTPMDVAAYGNNITLTNGITITVGSGIDTAYVPRANVTDPIFPVKVNGDWGTFAFTIDFLTQGVGDEMLIAALGSLAHPYRLDGGRNDAIRVRLNDDFTGLNAHCWAGLGVIENSSQGGSLAQHVTGVELVAS